MRCWFGLHQTVESRETARTLNLYSDTVGDVVLTLSPTDCLCLTRPEAIRLAEQVKQELICRTAAQVDQPIIVADIPLSAAEAWRLVDEIQQLHFEPDERNRAQADWITEGF